MRNWQPQEPVLGWIEDHAAGYPTREQVAERDAKMRAQTDDSERRQAVPAWLLEDGEVCG